VWQHQERGDALPCAPNDPSVFRYDLDAEWDEKFSELWCRFLINLDRNLNTPELGESVCWLRLVPD
jgi:hypothetical protein